MEPFSSHAASMAPSGSATMAGNAPAGASVAGLDLRVCPSEITHRRSIGRTTQEFSQDALAARLLFSAALRQFARLNSLLHRIEELRFRDSSCFSVPE